MSLEDLEQIIFDKSTDWVITNEYNIKGKIIGNGSFAQVYMGTRISNNEKVAVKTFLKKDLEAATQEKKNKKWENILNEM